MPRDELNTKPLWQFVIKITHVPELLFQVYPTGQLQLFIVAFQI